MEITPEQYKMIEDYIGGNMPVENEAAFEIELKNDPVLFEYYCFEIDMHNNLASMEFKKNFPSPELNQVILSNSATELKELVQNAEKQSGKQGTVPVQSNNVVTESTRNNRNITGKVILYRRWIKIAVAASIIGVVISVFWFNDNKKTAPIPIAKDNAKIQPVPVDSTNSLATKSEKAPKDFLDIFNNFFEDDETPEEKPIVLLAELENYKNKRYGDIQRFDADNPPPPSERTMADPLNSTQHVKELGHYYKGLSYISTNNLKLAKKNLQWVIEKASDKKLVLKAQWYMALTYLKENNTDKTISLLNQLEGNTRAAPYNEKAKELLNRLK